MIEYYMDSECVGCERCVNCGRNEKQPILENLVCDVCNECADELYESNGKHFCKECALKEAGFEKINEENFKEYIK